MLTVRTHRPLALILLLAALALLAAGPGRQTTPDGSQVISGQPATGDRADRLASPPDHLIVVIEENHS